MFDVVRLDYEYPNDIQEAWVLVSASAPDQLEGVPLHFSFLISNVTEIG